MSIIEIRDESRLCGDCAKVISPTSAEEIKEIIEKSRDEATQFTIAGARTGIVGGGVPHGGTLISTEKLKEVSLVQHHEITLGAGVSLEYLQHALAKEKKLYFPPNPTEETATLGGLFSCDGAGGNSRKYGSVADNTLAIEFVTATGMIWKIKRGDFVFDDLGCDLPDGLRLDCTVYKEATITKALTPIFGMDLIDFIAGSEGTLGVVTALNLQLKEKQEQWGILYFFSEIENAANYLDYLKNWDLEYSGMIEECEFFCDKTLALLEKKKATLHCLSAFPEFPSNNNAAVMVILSGKDSEVLENALIEHYEEFCELGGKDSDTWGFEGESEIEKLHTLRHAVPEIMNGEIDLCRQEMQQLTKISTDFLAKISLMDYFSDINSAKLRGYIFGHGLDNHYHINILVHSPQELLRAKELIYHWSKLVVDQGGMLVVENGIGKLKADLLQVFLTNERLVDMKKIKAFFDPKKQFNQGTILL